MAVVVRLEEAAGSALTSCAEVGLDYTEPMPVGEWSGKKTDLGLVVLSPASAGNKSNLSYLCLAAKGKEVATRFARAQFTSLVEVNPLAVRDWLTAMPATFQSHFENSISTSGRPVPPGTWTHAREALVRLRPEVSDRLTELEALLDAHLT